MSNKTIASDAQMDGYLPTDVEVEVNIPKCCVHYIISTSTQDREGDIMGPKAFVFDQHIKNPAATYDHNFDVPIGVWADTTNKDFKLENIQDFYSIKYPKDDVLEGDLYYNQNDPTAMAIFDMVVRGVMMGVSPGFLIKRFKPNPKHQYGRIIEEAILVEAGPCTLGENPDAVAVYVEKSLTKYKNINPKVLTDLNALLPRLKASMVITNKSNNKDDKATTDSGKEGKEGAKKEPEDQVLKPGHKALDTVHTAGMAYRSVIKKAMATTENETVLGLFNDLDEGLAGHLDNACKINGTEYPGHPELKAAEGSDHEIPEEEMRNAKSLKSLERGFKEMQLELKRLNQQALNNNKSKDKK